MGVTLAEQARDALHRHVLTPFVGRCVDQEYGGFLVDFDERWRPAGAQDKTLEHATRTTLAFALLDRALPGEGFDRLVRHGCAFLQSAMWDDVHGGFFAKVDRSGRPRWDGLKHPHAANYAARAFLLSEKHLPPGEGRKWASRALDWLNDVAWDEEYGGYWGSFGRDNARYPDGARLPTSTGRDVFGLTPGFKEINSQGDAIEMLAELTEQGVGGQRAADRLVRLSGIVIDRLIDRHGVMPYLFRRDWRPSPDLARVGYHFLMARHITVAKTALHGVGDPVARACDLVDFCLASARHPSGGFCFAVAADGRTWPGTGPASDLRQWWVQIEAVHTLHLLATDASVDPERRARYRGHSDEQWGFVRDHLFDERHGGIRELPLEPQPWRRLWQRSNPAPMKSHGWKDISHEVATFLALGAAHGALPTKGTMPP